MDYDDVLKFLSLFDWNRALAVFLIIIWIKIVMCANEKQLEVISYFMGNLRVFPVEVQFPWW
jgi:hypothetical protein